jgi:TonB family protein
MTRISVAFLLASAFAVAQTPGKVPMTIPARPLEPKVSGPNCTRPDVVPQAGVVERTLLDFHVGADGQIKDIVVLDSSGNTVLNDAAVRCLSGWHADPAEANGAGNLRAHIIWSVPSNNTGWAATHPIGTFTVSRINSCDGLYPDDERKARIGGKTYVKFHITTEGNVSSPEVVTSSGDSGLDQAAIGCVEHWRYQPAMQNGQAVGSEKEVVVDWIPR